MRILAVNKFHFLGGGAESVFFRTNELLESAGHEVIPFSTADPRNVDSPWSSYFAPARDYDHGGPLRRVRDASASVYSFAARRALRDLIRAASPEIAHLHNVYHQLSLSIVDEIRAARLPAVLTLHDYKPVCPAYRLLADDGLCERCVTGSPLNAVRHRCVKGSRAASAVAAVETYVSRVRHQYGKLDALISPSRFLADLMVRGGVSHRTLHVLPNFVTAEDQPRVLPKGEPRFLYAGRLSPEKGLLVLLDAARGLTGARLTIAGQGPLEAELRRRVDEDGLPVDFVGHLSPEDLAAQMRGSYAVLLPSVWYENCPMSILEAAAQGVPAVATQIGGTVELIESDVTGFLVEPGNAATLRATIESLARDRDATALAGGAAWRRARERHAPETYLASIMSIYETAADGLPTRAAS